jgi:hypothetical protein
MPNNMMLQKPVYAKLNKHPVFTYTIITLLSLACVSLYANAEDVELQKNPPERHIVVKGDTLWGISGKFLKNPWDWPKVWKMNRSEIKNPHRIYPGDVVILDRSGKDPQFKLLRETVKLEPHAIEEPLEKEAIHSISPKVITPFLSQPLLIENNMLETAPRIVAGQDNRAILSPGTRVYANGIKETDGTHWNVYRPGDALIDPETNQTLGTEAIYLGDVDITRFGSPATGTVMRAKEEIFVKDRLVVSPDEFKTSFVPHAPDADINGRIIRVYGGVAEAGPNNVVSINRGKKDGLEEGHVLAISRQGKIVNDPEYKESSGKPVAEQKELKELNFDVNTDADGKKVINFEKTQIAKDPTLKAGELRLPNERIGLLMIFRTFDKVSYGLIMSTTEPVYTLDAVSTP